MGYSGMLFQSGRITHRVATWPGTVKSWRKRPDPDGVDVEMPLGAPGMKWLCHVLFFFFFKYVFK